MYSWAATPASRNALAPFFAWEMYNASAGIKIDPRQNLNRLFRCYKNNGIGLVVYVSVVSKHGRERNVAITQCEYPQRLLDRHNFGINSEVLLEVKPTRQALEKFSVPPVLHKRDGSR
jgi:hypothetical protein